MPRKPDVVIPPDRRAAFSYRRVSDKKQADSGLGEEAQLYTNTKYFRDYLEPAGFAWGGDFVDSAVSARGKHFLQRKAADRLNLTVHRGDVIIIAKFDRAFRSIRDFANTTANWEQRGIKFAIVAQNWQNWSGAQTIYDKALLGMVAIFAELESDLISARTKEGLEAKAARGECPGGRPPPGKRRWGTKFIDDPTDRATCRLIVEMIDKGYSHLQVFRHLKAHNVVRYTGKPWALRTVGTAYHCEKQRQFIEEQRAQDDLLRFGRVEGPAAVDCAPF
jgi:DNA invertase Pin-like site-specific DNA recombinase